MELGEYFERTEGVGVLATADQDGKVDAAIYARPHVMEDGSLAFIMLDRLTHHNLRSNPHATYLFMEKGGGYRGRRLYLTMLSEEENSPLISKLLRAGTPPAVRISEEPKYLVRFRLDRELPLVGPG